MKRILSLLIALVLICTTFASCGKDSGIYYDYDMKKYVTVGKYSNVIDKESTDYDYACDTFNYQTLGTTKGKVEKGDIANIDYKGMLNGEAFEGGTDTGYDLEIGSGQFIPGFEDGLIGVEVGQTTNLNLKFPDNYKEDLAGKEVVFEVKVNYVVKKSQLTEESIKRYGFPSLADYEKKLEEYALGVCLFYNISRTATFKDYPKKEANLLYNYLITYYEDLCKQNNMTMKDLAEANNMSEDELYEYLEENEVHNEMEFYMVAYYVLSTNDAMLTSDEIEAKRAELAKQYDKPLEDVGYYEINIQQATAYDKALEILSKQAEIKK